MKHRIMLPTLCIVLSLMVAPAIAANPYIGGEGGVVFFQKSSLSGPGITDTEGKAKTGFGLGLVGGYDFGTFRVEGEFAYRKNNNKEITSGGVTFPVSGDVSSMALMLNGFYDFKSISPMIYPFIGAGVGGARISAKFTDDVGTFVDDDDTVFAWQVMAGVAYPVSKQLAIDLTYKLFATAKPEFTDIDGVNFKAEYMTHNILLGVRFNF